MEKFPDMKKGANDRREDDRKNQTRRQFLKLAGAAAALAGAKALSGSYESGRNDSNREKDVLDAVSRENVRRLDPAAIKDDIPDAVYQGDDFSELPEWEYIPGEDKEAVQNVLGKFDLKKVKLDLVVKEATENYWYEKYDGNMRESLIKAYNAMQKWKDRLEAIFTEEGVPAEYIYLAIPESHWSWKKPSPAGAVGPYQFMPETARSYGLKVNEKVDERKDVLKSARAAAKLLAALHGRTGNWGLALSGYNGGQIWGYINECGGGEDCNYMGFMEYMQEKINKLKSDLSKPVWKHEVLNRERSLGEIAHKFGVSVRKIVDLNKIPLDKNNNPIIRAGQVIDIPIGDIKTKEFIYESEAGGYIENLNYPAKYFAVMEHIKRIEKERMLVGRIKEM